MLYFNMARSKKNVDSLDAKNVKVIAQMIADSATSKHLSVLLINKLLESRGSDTFFPTMFEEGMSKGECPECGHLNHFLIPEDELNKLGWVTHEEDPEVSEYTDSDTCPEWEQACAKKRITI